MMDMKGKGMSYAEDEGEYEDGGNAPTMEDAMSAMTDAMKMMQKAMMAHMKGQGTQPGPASRTAPRASMGMSNY